MRLYTHNNIIVTIFFTVTRLVTKIVTLFNMIRFKERLRELRIERNIFQKDLGALLNVSKMTISHWESGHSEPCIAQLILLAEYFEVSVDYLIGKTDFM